MYHSAAHATYHVTFLSGREKAPIDSLASSVHLQCLASKVYVHSLLTHAMLKLYDDVSNSIHTDIVLCVNNTIIHAYRKYSLLSIDRIIQQCRCNLSTSSMHSIRHFSI
jgi:hypothetical protein